MTQIKKDTSLRKAILQAAVTGNLISTVVEPASAVVEPAETTIETGRQLLDRIIEERNKKLLEETKRNHTDLQISTKSAGKKSDLRSKSQICVTKKELPPITEEEIPFEIPENWCWCRWGELSDSIQYGYNAPAKESGRIKMVRITDIQNGKVEWENVPFCEISDEDVITYKLRKNDILFARTGGTVGKSFLVDEELKDAVFAGYLIRTQYDFEKLNPKYMKLFMESQLYWDQLKNGTIATAQPNCNGQTLSKMIVPLPPLAVQNAIVSKLEQVLPLVDAYENAVLQKELLKGALKDNVKKTILQEAVQGKLVPQIAGEGSAKDLLAEIKKNHTDLQISTKSAGKKSVTKKELPPITEDEIPFEIPENWCWCRLGDLIYNNGQKTPDKKFSYIDIGSIDNINQKLNEKENLILPEKAPSRARKIVKKGDIIYSTVRPYLHNMCIIDKDFSEDPIASTGFAVMSCCDAIYNKFLFYYLLSPTFDNYANDTENAKGVAYPAINDDKLYKGLVPLPPLAEQKRIVAAIEQLLPLCEKLGA